MWYLFRSRSYSSSESTSYPFQAREAFTFSAIRSEVFLSFMNSGTSPVLSSGILRDFPSFSLMEIASEMVSTGRY